MRTTTKRFEPKFNIRKDDTIQVLSGDDKGKKGRVLAVYRAKSRVLVEGVNIIKRHTKPNATYPNGSIVPKEAPIHISKVALLDAKSGKPTRVGKGVDKAGKSIRISKKSGEVIK